MEEVIDQLVVNKRLKEGTARHEKGKLRVHEILKLSREILAFEGYANFTLRNLCSRLDLSMGNLTYYFKTKHNIIHALVEETVQNYEKDFQKTNRQAGDDPEQQFLAHINYLLEDLKKPITRGFFFQIYGMSTHDPYVAKCKREFYQYALNTFSKLIAGLNPALNDKAVNYKALHLAALVEGMMVVLGPDKKIAPIARGFEDEFRKQALNIALSGEV